MMPRLLSLFVVSVIAVCVGQRASGQYRSLYRIEYRGLQTIETDNLQNELAELPEVVESLHPSIDESVFRFRTHEALSRGLLSAGFLDRKVTVAEPTDRTTHDIAFELIEGQRFRWGTIQVKGTSDAISTKLASYLSEITTDEEKEDKLWNAGEPSTGTLFGRLRYEHQFRKELSKLGLDSDGVEIDFHRDDEKLLVDAVITLNAKNAFAVIQYPETKPDAETKPETQTPTTEVSPASDRTATTKSPVAIELDKIYQRYFAEFASSIVVTRREDDGINRVGFGDQCVWFEGRTADDQSQKYAIVFRDEDLVLALDDGRSAWQLPSINVTLKLTQKSLSESEGNGCFGLEFNGSIHSDPKDAPPSIRGFHFTESGWKEWFPPSETTIEKDANGVHFSYGNHVMDFDTEGNLVQITGLDPFNHDITITPTADSEVKRMGDQLVQKANVQRLFIRSADGSEIALASMLKHTFHKETPEGYVYISPANGTSDLWACVMLSVLNDEFLFPKDSVLGKLGAIWALEMSSYDETLVERMNEIEPEALQGPLTAAMLAELAKRLNLNERSKGYFADAIRLCDAENAVSRDLQRLLSHDTLAGQIVETIDIKSLLKLALELQKDEDSQTLTMLKTIVDMMPESKKPADRRSSAILLSRVLFQSQFQEPFQRFCQQRIDEIEQRQAVRQAKIAEKKKKKDEAKKKR